MTISQRLTLLTLTAVVVSSSLSYCAGRRAGAQSVKLRTNATRIRTAVHSRRAAEIQRAKDATAAARVDTVWRVARARVAVTSDTTVSIDRLADIPLPRPVITILRAGDEKVAADSVLIASLERENAALREERDAWKERAELLKPPRCGMKCGIAIGGSIVLVVVGVVARVF